MQRVKPAALRCAFEAAFMDGMMEELMEQEIGFCCPICGGSLSRRDRGAVCPEGHRFDMARQGYLHLLPPNKMNSRLPGDSREMVESRRWFLDAGYYAPFRDKLCGLAKDCAGLLEQESPGPAARGGDRKKSHPSGQIGNGLKILDAGCGEGYYTGALRDALPAAEVYGFDISKLAVKAAAGRYKGISFAVASSFSIPVPTGFCDLLFDVFSPLAEEEFARVVKPGGFFIYAVPGERHLLGLKEILYETPYENQRRETKYPGFSFVSRHSVRDEIWVPNAETAHDLFAMTPYFWKTGIDGGKRLEKTRGFSTEIAFDFLAYRRKP